MVFERHEFYQSSAGEMGECEDWFTLLLDPDTGRMQVEHEWSYLQGCGRGGVLSGKRMISLPEFMCSPFPDQAKQALVELVALLSPGD